MFFNNGEFNFNKIVPDYLYEKNIEALNYKIDPTKHFRSFSTVNNADDFYTSLLDWHDNKIFFVENNSVFCYDFYTEMYEYLFESLNTVTSIKYNMFTNKLVTGDSLGSLTFYDMSKETCYKFSAHRSRIGVIKTFQNNNLYKNSIITGSRDRTAKIFDNRTSKPTQTLTSHIQEVCGIAENKYIATGGNDNLIFIYEPRANKHVYQLAYHRAAIKALDWTNDGNTLATGGGSADKTIKFFTFNKNPEMIKSIQFDSQITNLKYINDNSLICCFGYCNNDIKILRDYKITQAYEGHKNRVLHFAISNDSNKFATGSNDGLIKIWKY